MTQSAFVFGLLGNIASFMVLLAPLPTFYEIFKKKSTEGFQSVLYVVGLFSAMLWIYYSLLKPNMLLIITINTVSSCFYSAYICVFLVFAQKDDKVNTVKLFLLLNVVGFGLIVLLTYFLTEGSNRANIVGMDLLDFFCVRICCTSMHCVGVLFHTQRKVIRSKSVEYMHFLPSFFLTLGAVMWFFYGLLHKDYNIVIPNVVGLSLGVVQMVLYMMYGNGKKQVGDQKQTPNDVMAAGEEQNNYCSKEVCEIKDEKIVDAYCIEADQVEYIAV